MGGAGMMGMGMMGMGMGGAGGAGNGKEIRRALGNLDDFGTGPGTVWIDGPVVPGNAVLGTVGHLATMPAATPGGIAPWVPRGDPYSAGTSLLAGVATR